MTKQEYLEAAKETLLEKHEAIGSEFNNSLDTIVSLACTMSLRDIGVTHLGQPVRVLKGRHEGLIAPIEMIDWSEAAVRLKGCARWFCVWGDPGMIKVAE